MWVPVGNSPTLHGPLRLRIKARARLPLLLHQLAKTGQNEFAVLFDLFVREVAERIEEYSSGSFVGIRGSSERDLKFTFGDVWQFFMAVQWQHCKRIAVSPSPLTVKNET